MAEPTYCVIKLITGETLFAEILSKTDTQITILNPLEIHMSHNDGDSMSATEWMPFVSQEVFSISVNAVFFVGALNNYFMKFYGSVLLQSEISKIKREISESMQTRMDYPAMLEGVERMKKLAQTLKDKFKLDDDVIDFSEFDKRLEKHKNELVLH